MTGFILETQSTGYCALDILPSFWPRIILLSLKLFYWILSDYFSVCLDAFMADNMSKISNSFLQRKEVVINNARLNSRAQWNLKLPDNQIFYF